HAASHTLLFFPLPLPPPTTSPLFPYTTLFRSESVLRRARRGLGTGPLSRPSRPRPRFDSSVADLPACRPGPGGRRSRDRGRPCLDRKSTRLNSSHLVISYAVFCLKKKNKNNNN